MWIKKTKVKNKEYIQVVKSIRDGKKVKHKVVLNLGRSEDINKKNIEQLINVLTKYFELGGEKDDCTKE